MQNLENYVIKTISYSGTSLISSMEDSPNPDHKRLFQSVHDKDGFYYIQAS